MFIFSPYLYFNLLFLATEGANSSKSVHTGGSNSSNKNSNIGINGVSNNSNREREKDIISLIGNNNDLMNAQYLNNNNNINNINNMNINISKNQISSLHGTHTTTTMNVTNNGNTLNLGVFGPDGLLLKKSRRSHGDGKYLYVRGCAYVHLFL